MSLSEPITARTEPETYQITINEAGAISAAVSVVKIFSTATLIAWAVAGCRCGLIAG
jgi:hypothetical protein